MQPLRIFLYTVGIMNFVPGLVLGALMAGGLARAGRLEAQTAPRKLIVESAALETMAGHILAQADLVPINERKSAEPVPSHCCSDCHPGSRVGARDHHAKD